jgi:hypothetical protein
MTVNNLIFTVILAVFYFLHPQRLYADDKVDKAVHVLVSLCLSGGSAKLSRSQFDVSGNKYDLESANGNFTVESREVIGFVDGLGTALNQLSADQANRARDCMKPFIAQVLGLIQPVPGQTSPVAANRKLAGIAVSYYLKSADGTRVSDALRGKGISFSLLNSFLPDSLQTNAIMCGRGTPVEAIKELALALTDADISVRSIVRIRSDTANVLYLAAFRDNQKRPLRSPPLSRNQIDQISTCPPTFESPIANFTHFDRPKPTGRAADSRYVDGWFDRDQIRDSDDAAGLFCTQRGFGGSTNYKVVEAENSIAVHLGDNSECQGKCLVFQFIDCD